jgi:hypothetical protein
MNGVDIAAIINANIEHKRIKDENKKIKDENKKMMADRIRLYGNQNAGNDENANNVKNGGWKKPWKKIKNIYKII